MIPKVLFTSFRDEREDNETVDALLSEWEGENSYEIKYFSDADLDEYFENHPRREVFEMIKSGVARADYFRVCYLQSHGGTWFDFDLGPFEFHLPAEAGVVLYDMGFGDYSYMLLSSEAKEPLWEAVLTEVDIRVINPEPFKNVVSITGPCVLQYILGSGGAGDDSQRTRKEFTFFYAKGPKVEKKTKIYREKLRAGHLWGCK